MTYIDYLNDFNQWLESNPLPGNAQLMYFRLLNVFNRAGWPEQVQVDTLRLMLMTDCQKDAAYRARDKLRDAGFIQYRKGKKGSPTTYFLSDRTTESATENASESTTESATENATHIKTKKKTKTKKDNPLTPLPAELGFGPSLVEALEKWTAYRRELRKPLTATGWKSLLSKVGKYAGEYGEAAVVETIECSMSNGWQGVFFERLEKRRSQQDSSFAYDYSDTEGSL